MRHLTRPPATPIVYRLSLYLITYSVFRLAARRTGLCGWIPRVERAPVSEKRVGLNRSLVAGLWALNVPGRLLVGHRGIPGDDLEPFAAPTRLSSGQHSLPAPSS